MIDPYATEAKLARAERRIAVLEQVIAEAICFPSAGLPDHQIKWLHAEICAARDSHKLRMLQNG